jgi:NDP-mannose synthase
LSNQAIILAGGQGTRLRPYTTVLPKALVPIGDVPILDIILQQLKHYGFERVTLAVGHMASLIQTFVGDGRRWGLTITYVQEHKPLGTAGPIKLLSEGLPDNFLVMNSDVLSSLALDQLFAQHQQSGALATIASFNRQVTVPFGVLTTQQPADAIGEDWRITQFVEKPVLHHWISMGVYAFNKHVVNYIEPDTLFGFDHLMQALLAANQPVQAFPFYGYWLDIGCISDYEQAVLDFSRDPGLLLPNQHMGKTSLIKTV